MCIYYLSGTLKKVYFKSNASEPVVTDDEVQVPGVFLVTTVYNESAGAPATPPSQFTPAWTPRAPPHSVDQSHRNASKSEVADMNALVSVTTHALKSYSQSYENLDKVPLCSLSLASFY